MMKLEELLNKLHNEQGLIKKDFWYFQTDKGHVIQSFNIPTHVNKHDINFSGTAEKSIWKSEEICIDFKTTCLYGKDIIDGITRPVGPVNPVHTKLIMTPKAEGRTYDAFIRHGWDDDQLIEYGYAKRPICATPDVTVTRVNDDRLTESLRWSPSIIGTETITAQSNCRCTFTPVQQPSTAPDLLNQAAQLLAERGQQYDKSGNERSSAKIVAVFNTITGRDLTPGEGWLFLTLLKAVRFYSNTEIPHRDSLEDMIAYAALHAEEYLNDK